MIMQQNVTSQTGRPSEFIYKIGMGGDIEPSLLGPAPTGIGTIALDPTFVSFLLLKPVSH